MDSTTSNLHEENWEDDGLEVQLADFAEDRKQQRVDELLGKYTAVITEMSVHQWMADSTSNTDRWLYHDDKAMCSLSQSLRIHEELFALEKSPVLQSWIDEADREGKRIAKLRIAEIRQERRAKKAAPHEAVQKAAEKATREAVEKAAREAAEKEVREIKRQKIIASVKEMLAMKAKIGLR